ncbi:RNA polymerase sigma factor FecI [Klebsiella michiganensis]|uniref:RNA polymerase sigma factor n=1 Tax=Klebsiella michiganensis TaxID=1134687 RepID=A0A7H4LUV8_9ENTR|nr:RNA polymerase sigma factor FecI [Klebsiella michiganensis]
MSPSSAIASPLTLASLYSDHHGWLKKWLTHKLQSAYDADDVAQDTFVRIMAGESLLTIRDPKSFLCTIAKRVMIDLFRRNALERAWLDMLSQLPPELSPHRSYGRASSNCYSRLMPCWTGLTQKPGKRFCSRSLKG